MPWFKEMRQTLENVLGLFKEFYRFMGRASANTLFLELKNHFFWPAPIYCYHKWEAESELNKKVERIANWIKKQEEKEKAQNAWYKNLSQSMLVLPLFGEGGYFQALVAIPFQVSFEKTSLWREKKIRKEIEVL